MSRIVIEVHNAFPWVENTAEGISVSISKIDLTPINVPPSKLDF